MNKWLELLVGLILVILPILGAVIWFPSWGQATLSLIKGGVVMLLILVGLVFIMLGISDLRD